MPETGTQTLDAFEAADARLGASLAQKRRSDEMFGQRVITAQEHETSALDYANAQAAVIRARANSDIAKQKLEDATVRPHGAGHQCSEMPIGPIAR